MAHAAAPAEEDLPPFTCTSCGHHVHGERPDDAGWCKACRRGLITRATRLAWVPVAVVAVLYLWLMVWSGLLESPWMAFWLALGVGLAFVAYKVARRVFFDLLRGRVTGERAKTG